MLAWLQQSTLFCSTARLSIIRRVSIPSENALVSYGKIPFGGGETRLRQSRSQVESADDSGPHDARQCMMSKADSSADLGSNTGINTS